MDIQSVHWTGGWTIASGCVERVFTLGLPEKDQLLPRYRAQIQGFIGGTEELYIGLLEINRAIESDVDEMMGRIAQEGRVIFTMCVDYEGDASQYVISLERDPRDLMPEVGGWPALRGEFLQGQIDEAVDKSCVPKDAVSTQDCRGTEYGRISTAKPSEVDLKPGQSILRGVETGRISSEHPNPGTRPKLLAEHVGETLPPDKKKEEGSD
jgi:hypothetical protein